MIHSLFPQETAYLFTILEYYKALWSLTVKLFLQNEKYTVPVGITPLTPGQFLVFT